MIRQMAESLMNSARITSASPNFVNRVEGYDWFGETGNFENVIRDEVRIIMEEQQGVQETEKSYEKVGTPPAEESEGTNVEATMRKMSTVGVKTMNNPVGAMASSLQGVAGKLPYVGLAIALAPIIFKELTRDGSELDLRFRRKLEKEQNAFLDRQTQRNTQIGLRQVIVQSRAGFIQVNGAGGNENNIRQIREGGVDGNRLAQIDIIDHSKELFAP